MGNKDKEIECLNIAKNECLKQRGISKRIGMLISGEDIINDITVERPDFIKRYISYNDRKKENIVIGIEHFRVDQYSEKVKKRKEDIISSGCAYISETNRKIGYWKNLSVPLSFDNEIIVDDIKQIAEKNTNLYLKATYHNFIESLRYGLKNHVDSIDTYHSNLKKYAKNNEIIRLAFLIEFHADFSDLFFHDKKGIHFCNNNIPLFNDMVNILETIDSRKVHYLILCFGSLLYDENIKVIAVPTNKLREHLKSHHINIYEYAGEDVFLHPFQTPFSDVISSECSINNDSLHIKCHANAKIDQALLAKTYLKVRELEENNCCYATTSLIERIHYCCNEYHSLLFDRNSNINTNIPINIFPLLQAKSNEFEDKWRSSTSY